MGTFLTKYLALAASFILTFHPQLSLAEETPSAKIGVTNDHHFMSALQAYNKEIRIHHEVCNLSKSPSGLIWEKAGLAIDSLSQLNSFHCARRVQYGVKDFKADESNVSFQNGDSGKVDTIFKCHKLLGVNSCDEDLLGSAARSALSLSLLMSKPDETNYRVETVYISVSEGDGVLELRVYTSDGITKMAIVLDSEQVDLSALKDAFSDENMIEIDTFGYFRKTGEISESFISNLFNENSPTIIFRGDDESPIDFADKLRNIRTLGDAISLTIINGDDIIAFAENHLQQPLK